MTRIRVAVMLAAAVALATPAAGETNAMVVTAVAPSTFAPPVVLVVKGGGLLFAQGDVTAPHNVQSRDLDAQGRPLFESETLTPGRIGAVAGVSRLPAGEYQFTCSIHPAMFGLVQVYET
jgi:plastocyanin